MVIWHLKKTGKVKKLSTWVSHELTEKKKSHFEISSSLILWNNNKPFLSWIVTCNENWILSMVGLRSSSKSLLKVKLTAKNCHGHCVVVCTSFDPLQLSESWKNHHIWEVCSASGWDVPKTSTLVAIIGQKKWPNSSSWQCLTSHHTTNASKIEQIESKMCHIHHTCLISHTWLQLIQAPQQLFQGKMF